MKYLLIGSLCLSILSGCQTYPKNASQVSGWSGFVPVNKVVPSELQPYKIPPKVEYVDTKREVPKSVVVIK